MAIKRTDPAKKTEILKALSDGMSVPKAAKEHGVSEATIYSWPERPRKRSKKRAAKAGAPKKAAPKPAAAATNGHAPSPGLPTIELRGLRDWVNAAVDARLDARFKQLASLGRQ